jgi:hypothetical protein
MKSILSRISKALYRQRYIFRKANYGPKIFCVGFIRTGTTSLGQAFERLGYLDSGYKSFAHVWYTNKEFKKIIAFTAKIDTTSDIPWSHSELIPLLDKAFPNSKFIYLVRDESEWKPSYVKFHKRMNNIDADPDVGWQNLLNHKNFVLDYFKEKPSQLIQLEISDPMGLRKLTEFIGKAFISEAFPHLNKSK